jgi:DNA topoisomerase-3
MLHLVRHFGDKNDSGKNCGICDICAPDISKTRVPDAKELVEVAALFRLIAEREGQSLGRMHREGAPKLDRKVFESYLSALAKAGFIDIEERSFDKEGQKVAYRTARVVVASFREADLMGRVRLGNEESPASKVSRKRAKKTTLESPATHVAQETLESGVAALKQWRLSEAKLRKAPAFTILSDRTLQAIATAKPQNLGQLEAVHGMGPKLVEKHGQKILEVLASLG